MFHATYIRRELRRRAGRTALTVTGLAVGVALVVAITAVSSGLDQAQAKVLDPLQSLGTDLLVTRTVETTAATGSDGTSGAAPGGGGGFALGGGSGLSREDQQALVAENQSVVTDLSKLGKPGDEFVHDFFLPATQLTFPASQVETIAGLDGVESVASGLTLLAQHQEGTVPEIVAEIQTGGEEIQVDQQITPPTAEEQAAIQTCLAEKGVTITPPSAGGGTGGTATRPESPVAGDGGPGAGGPPGAFGECLPERFRQFRARVMTPQRTLRQVLDPPQTDITSEPYTIAGVDLAAAIPGPSPEATSGLGLLTAAQISDGTFFTGTGDAREVVLAEAYAGRKNLKVGSTLDLNGETYSVVGLAHPPLGGQTADVYLPLADLQRLSSRTDRANVLLVRATSAADVADLTQRIEEAFPGAKVTNAKDLADQVSGSLVDAAGLADRLGNVLAIVVLAAAFLVAALLTLASVAKRVQELGTLKAIGWSQRMVVRQVVGESVVQGVLGGLLGAGLGVGAAALAASLSPTLQASAPAGGPSGLFGLGQVAVSTVGQAVPLDAPVDPALLAFAIGLAVFGGLLAAPPAPCAPPASVPPPPCATSASGHPT
jgi:putative ABC transport system permease protein